MCHAERRRSYLIWAAAGLSFLAPVVTFGATGDRVTIDSGALHGATADGVTSVMVGANSADIGFAPGKSVDEVFAAFGPDADRARAVYNPDHSTDLRAVAGKVGGDLTMIEPAREIARLLSKRGQPVYEYRFSYIAESLRGKWPGALHATEIPFAFDTVSARYGKDLTPAGEPAWPAYDAKTDRIMDSAPQRP
jgi:para-nitrobenzyl esterase